jgi:hypothetical protein
MGHQNSFFGLQSGLGNRTGYANSFFGNNAGILNDSGYINTAIGFFSTFGAGDLTNATAVGAFARVDQDNSLVLGSIAGVNAAGASTKVGIGITAPTATLTVVSTSTSATDNTARFQASNIGPNQSHIHYGTNGDWYIRSAAAAGKVILQDTGGNVGIGTGSPDATLTVNGGADKPGGGSWAVYSDERLKSIKGRFTPGLMAVMQLQPVRYKYRHNNALGITLSGEQIGFGAQAVQKIIPEAVITNAKGYLLINNDPILWAMLNAIKEQQQEIEEQQRTAQQQQEQLKEQQSEIESLKKLVCLDHPTAKVCRK